MQDQSFTNLQRALSPKRLEAYRPRGGSNNLTVQNYFWNASVCEASFPMLQQLEVAFRNTLHQSIAAAFGDNQWLTNGISFLKAPEQNRIMKAKDSLIGKNSPITEDDLVGELSFGFWTSLGDRRYDGQWPRFIKNAFPNCIAALRTRSEISSRSNKLRKLRNYVFHHHSIWHWNDLQQHHADGMALIGWTSPDLAKYTRENDRFLEILSNRPIYPN